MRIGIDATAVPPKPMGAGLYVIHLIRELTKLECIRFFPFSGHPDESDVVFE